jgi:hypothetical protein
VWFRIVTAAFDSSGVLERATQEKLDLRVDAPQLVARPALECGVRRRIEAQQKSLPLGHPPLLVERTGVDDRLRPSVRAEHDQQIAHHRGLPLLIETDDLLLGQLLQRHLHHADRAVDNFSARRDDGARLLALEHGVRDLW